MIGTLLNDRYRLEAELGRGEPGDGERAGALLQEARMEFEAMGIPLYAAQVADQLEALEAG